MTREFRKIQSKQEEPEISIELIDGKRKISFEKDCLDKVEIFRREHEGDWISLVKNISSPYFDEEEPESDCIEYKVQIFSHEGDEKAEAIFQVRE